MNTRSRPIFIREGEIEGDGGWKATSVPLYAEDSYLREFNAKIIKAGPRYVVLDKTCFYPKSGGQPSDTGFLIYKTESVRVFKALKRGNDIFHYIVGDLPEGATVKGVLDWDARYLNMRKHSAEHLLSGLFDKAGAGPKVYSDLTRLEFKPSALTEEVVKQVWEEFNEVVEAEMPIKIFNIEKSELDAGEDERKRAFLDGIPRDVEKLRMVEISGYDINFCFGTHVRYTREIGPLDNLELKHGKKQRKTVFFKLK